MKSQTLPALAGIAAALLAAWPLQRAPAAPAAAPSPPAIVGVTDRPFVQITLQDAVAMALLKNPNLAVSAGNARIARYQIAQAKAPFDVQLHLQPASNFSVLPPQNIFFAGPGLGAVYQCIGLFGQHYACTVQGPGYIEQHQYQVQAGVNGQTIAGATYSAGIVRTRTYNNLILNTFNPYYQSSLDFELTQPLFRNLGMNSLKRQLKLSFVAADASAAQTLLDASQTIAQVEDAYWDLVAAWRSVAIAEDALDEAVTQQRTSARIAARGAAPPIAAVEAQTQVATFQSNLYSALQHVSDVQNELKALIVTDPADTIWSANLVPSSPVQQLPSTGDLAAIVAQGEVNRPEVRQAQDRERRAELDHAYAKNQLLPQADVQAQFESNGAAGTLAPTPAFESAECNARGFPGGACPTPPPESQGKMGKATSNMWAFRYPTFNIALIFNVPLDNTLARSLLHAADQERRQADIEVQGVSERIGVEARNALQLYQSAVSRLYSATQSRAAAQAVYASELRRFHAGASTTFLVLQRQVQLSQARGRELQAQTDLNKAVVEMQRVEGTLLTSNGVDLETLGSKALGPTPRP